MLFQSDHRRKCIDGVWKFICILCVFLFSVSCRPWQEAKDVITLADSLDQTQHVIYDDTAALDGVIRTLFTPDVYAISKNAEYEGVEYLQGFYNGESNAVENIGSYNMPECDFNPSYIKQRVEPTSQDNTNRYLVYPTWLTPKEQIVIALPSDTETMCTLFSLYGNIVYKTNLIQRENRITLPNYILPGSYLLTLQSKDGDTYNSPILVYK